MDKYTTDYWYYDCTVYWDWDLPIWTLYCQWGWSTDWSWLVSWMLMLQNKSSLTDVPSSDDRAVLAGPDWPESGARPSLSTRHSQSVRNQGEAATLQYYCTTVLLYYCTTAHYSTGHYTALFLHNITTTNYQHQTTFSTSQLIIAV